MADIRLAKPAAGATQSVPCEPDARFVFDFPTTDATLAREGDNLNIRFEDGSSLQLQGFYEQYNEENLPSFSIDGTEVAAADFFQAMNEPDLMPAAGPGTGTAANGARFHEWGDSSLTGGIDHLNGLDWGFSRSFEWEDRPNAVGYHHDDDGPGNTVPGIEVPGGGDPEHNEGDHFVASKGGSVVVDEGALDAGSGLHKAHGAGGEGAFTVDVHDEKGGSIELSAGDDVVVLQIPTDGATTVELSPEGAQFHVNGVDITVLSATSDGNGKWTVSYTYELTESVEHNKNHDEDTVKFDAEGLHIKVTDGSGDVATSTLTVEVHDDVPVVTQDGTPDPAKTEGDLTSDLTGHFEVSFGADKAASMAFQGDMVQKNEADGTYSINDGDGELVIRLGDDGKWEYEYKVDSAKANDSLKKTFTFNAVDGDGDTAPVTITVSQNYKPEVLIPDPEHPDANGAHIVVDEGTQVEDPDHGADAHVQSGQGHFKVDLHGEDGTITLSFGKQKPVELTLTDGEKFNPDGADDLTLTVNGVKVTITGAEQGEDGQWSVNYKYNLTEAQQHGADGSDTDYSLGGDISITVTDTSQPSGSATGTLTVVVHDDKPVIMGTEPVTTTKYNDIDENIIDYEGSLEGNFNLNFGADDKAETAALQVKYGDKTLTMIDNGDGTYSALIAGGTLTLSEGEGHKWTYTFTPDAPNTTFDKELTIIATDHDGDTAETPIHVFQNFRPEVKIPDGPDAGGAHIVVDEGTQVEDPDHGADAHGQSGQGQFKVDLHGEDGTITLSFGEGDATQTVTLDVENGKPFGFAEEDDPTLTVNGVKVTITGAEQGEDGQWSVNYEYNLTGAQKHGEDDSNTDYSLGGDIHIEVKDGSGDVATSTLTVEVHDDAPELHGEDLSYDFAVKNTDYLPDTGTGFEFLSEKGTPDKDGKYLLSGFSKDDVALNPDNPDIAPTISAVHVKYEITESEYVTNQGPFTHTFEHEITKLGIWWDATPDIAFKYTHLNVGNSWVHTATEIMDNGEEITWYEFALDGNTDYTDRNAMIRVRILDDHTIEWKYSENPDGTGWNDNYDMSHIMPFTFGIANEKEGQLTDEQFKVGMQTYNPDDDGLPIIESSSSGVTLAWTNSGLSYKNENGELQQEFQTGREGASVHGGLEDAYGVEIDLHGQLVFGFTADIANFFDMHASGDGAPERLLITFYHGDEIVGKHLAISDSYGGDWKGEQVGGYIEDGFDRVIITPLDNGDMGHNINSNFSLKGVNFITKPQLGAEISGKVVPNPGADGFDESVPAAPHVMLNLSDFLKDDGTGKPATVKDAAGKETTGQWEYLNFGDTEVLRLMNGETSLLLISFNHENNVWEVSFSSTSMEISMEVNGKDIFTDIFSLHFTTTDSDGDTVSLDQLVPLSESVAHALDGDWDYTPTPLSPKDGGYYGTDGNDTHPGSDGNDTLIGGNDNDTLEGGAGKDTLLGGDGNDVLRGGAGNDQLYGEDGDDQLFGGKGDDLLFGGKGDDLLHGGEGADMLLGGDGDDLIVYDKTDYLIDGGDGIDFLLAGKGDDVSLGTLLSNDNAANGPIVKNVEVLLKGVDTADPDLTSMAQLADRFGLSFEKGDDGQERLIVNTDQWTQGKTTDGVTTWTNANTGITMETTLETSLQSSEADGQAVLTAKVAAETGGN